MHLKLGTAYRTSFIGASPGKWPRRMPCYCATPRCSYTVGMKTAVSLPDEVFTSAESLAKRLKLTRSELYSRALAEFLSRHSSDQITDSWNAVVGEVGEDETLPTEVARAVFEQVEW